MELGGNELFLAYDSLELALSTVYPEHKWHPLKFDLHSLPPGYWADIENQRKFLNRIGPRLGVKEVRPSLPIINH